MVARDKRAQFAADAPLLDRRRRARGLARSRPRRARAHRTPRSSPSPARSARPAPRRCCGSRSRADGETHASAASYNNHWGVPLSLARMPASAKYAVFEIGMNHAGEITPLTKLVRPHVAIVTDHRAGASGIFRLARRDRRRQGGDLRRPRAGRRRGAQSRQRANMRGSPRAAKAAGVARIVSFGENAKADARLLRHSLQAECSTVEARILGPGGHLQARRARPASGAQFARRAGGGRAGRRRSGAGGARARPISSRPAGAARAPRLRVPGGSALLIDESYNANPASMAAALALLGQAAGRPARPPHRRAGRHAGAGGARARRCTAAWPQPIEAAGVDLVFCAGR